ncbi:MAG TPA: type III pantothenate kinase, partial [Actinomycetota bacterium]|nr:type III pantothenate kinase [Actinomycetota bacterium]
MLLAVDVGNTQTHIGVFSGEKIAAEWRTSTDPRRTADELALIFQEFLSFQDLSFSRQVTGVVIASVVPALTRSLREMVERYFHFAPIVVEPGIRTGLPVMTDNPREVGADRIVNSVAAFALLGGPVIAIDFGTATTFDVVSHDGHYLGGAIAPGVTISASALWNIA